LSNNGKSEKQQKAVKMITKSKKHLPKAPQRGAKAAKHTVNFTETYRAVRLFLSFSEIHGTIYYTRRWLFR
jgi:hypothetical protein